MSAPFELKFKEWEDFTYRAKGQRQVEDAHISEELHILSQPCGFSTFEDGACI